MKKISNIFWRNTMKRTVCWQTFGAFALVLTMQTVLNGQEATGKIIGTVSDPQGAVIPGAKVTATNTGSQSSQVSREAVTDEDGNYQIPALPIGTYRVTVERD